MNIDNLQFGRLAVDKFLDIRYCDEVVFGYLGVNTYSAINNYIHEDSIEAFQETFEEAGTDWSCLMVKVKHSSGLYRDVYMKIRKQRELVKGVQLWDIYVYDVDILVLAYHELLLTGSSLKFLADVAEINYFKYEHATNIISFCRILNSREVIFFSMDLDEWSRKAFALGHVDEGEEATFTNFYLDIKMGKKKFSANMKFGLAYDTDEMFPCTFDVKSFYREGIPWRTIGCIHANGYSAGKVDANLDPLTGLYSKKAVAEQIQKQLQIVTGNAALFILDIDNFKDANDNYGHLFGDQVLSKIARVITDVIGANGVAGRFGGDEFIGVITNYTDRDELKGKLRSIRSRIEYLFANIQDLNITCSIGACEREPDIYDYDTLFAYADKCLYIAKDKGKNRYIIYLKEIHGDLILDDGKIAEIKTTVQGTNILSVINESVSILYREKYAGIGEVLDKVIEELGFDRVNIYYGEGYPRILYRERQTSEYEYAFFAESKDYLDAFDENGVLTLSTLHKVREINKDVYQIYMKLGIENLIQVIIGTKADIKGFVSFECCHLVKKRSESSVNYLHILANFIGMIIEEYNG
ncbi:MAG: GGDEF domain-containing protein [Lachnospiraceae bacterium]|nr:GGDEF domain-containing protein [Lachnospiraceae bacterium]